MGMRIIDKFAYAFELKEDVLILTADEKISVPEVMLLMVKHGALECRVYETNGMQEMNNWNFVTMYTGLMTSF